MEQLIESAAQLIKDLVRVIILGEDPTEND